MEYKPYVPPHIVAKEAREILDNLEPKTDDELWEELMEMGLIRELEDGSIEVRPDLMKRRTPENTPAIRMRKAREELAKQIQKDDRLWQYLVDHELVHVNIDGTIEVHLDNASVEK